ncbi:MAG TPA: type III secretion inner membrane ring lipoprotein SctJ [Rhabdochlamydiaceae bacterium]|nr:type III secretion inner membrane ring lipoprotein SctJ [Rhabdochlamydiaceae bacterium]
MNPKKFVRLFLILSVFLFLTGCEKTANIVNDVPEREANEIVVFLASKGINAIKTTSPSTTAGGGEATNILWSISVDESQVVEAMAFLTQNGLPRRKSISLLDIFAKSGLVSSDREETIRYQVGLAQQIAGTIRKIDGVLDADLELSFPPESTGIPGAPGAAAVPTKITASVYVKHQGILDDPNSHLVTKIKRLVASSITGLDLNDVTVISDRARYAEVTVPQQAEEMTPKEKEYVSIWSIVLNRASAGRFRMLFFVLIFATIIFALLIGWLIWKFYPLLRKKGFKNFLNPAPYQKEESEE